MDCGLVDTLSDGEGPACGSDYVIDDFWIDNEEQDDYDVL